MDKKTNCKTVDRQPLTVVLSGQKRFGKSVLKILEHRGYTIAAVVVPLDDTQLRPYAEAAGYHLIPAGSLTADTLPDGVDLGVCAHSFDYIGRKTRARTRLGWIGYHPSLLPRHRGRSAIEWALRFRDPVTGGTVFWLDDGIDRGDIIMQEWRWLDHDKTAKQVWDEDLMPLGTCLMDQVLAGLSHGYPFPRKPQEEVAKFSTFEPGLDNVKDTYKPDLLKLDAPVPEKRGGHAKPGFQGPRGIWMPFIELEHLDKPDRDA